MKGNFNEKVPINDYKITIRAPSHNRMLYYDSHHYVCLCIDCVLSQPSETGLKDAVIQAYFPRARVKRQTSCLTTRKFRNEYFLRFVILYTSRAIHCCTWWKMHPKVGTMQTLMDLLLWMEVLRSE